MINSDDAVIVSSGSVGRNQATITFVCNTNGLYATNNLVMLSTSKLLCSQILQSGYSIDSSINRQIVTNFSMPIMYDSKNRPRISTRHRYRRKHNDHIWNDE